MRIPRTNFPLKADEFEFESRDRKEPIHVPVPPAPRLDPANEEPGGLYESVVVRRSTAPASPKTLFEAKRSAISDQNIFGTDKSSAPISKRMFSLSENVRFTRTPDSELVKGKGSVTEQAITLPEDEPMVAEPLPSSPKTVEVPGLAAETLPSLLFSQAIQVQSPGAAHPQTLAKALPDIKATPLTASPLVYVSDYAFFETASFIGAIAPVVTAAAKPGPRFSPDEITARFRVLEYNKTKAHEEPIKPQPISPLLPPAVETHQDEPTAELRLEKRNVIDVNTSDMCPPGPPLAVQRTLPRRRDIAPAQAPLPPRRTAMLDSAEPRISPASHITYEKPSVTLLQEAVTHDVITISQETLEQNAGLLESVLEDFGIRGEIIHVRPGPVVTLYEFEPAPGVKSSRVIGLADDIARSMSALSARVAVVPGRNVIGIELPNATRETVYLREMVASENFDKTRFKLALCLGKTIGGEPVIAELAKMPHLLVAGTTGSGKSVAINTMIVSLLYRLTPEECRLIMVDPKMLELSIYDGIPHLLTPVVTDPKKAVMALKWAVREMEDRYRKMSKLGVRNIDGFNARVTAAQEKGETVMCTVQTGFDKGTGEAQYQQEPLDLTPMPYIVIIVDEMADLMMVAGKDIEGAIQRLAQMARAAGIHLIMATQRPSVDVITGTIKANFPTRISFQVTSKIDSRTILGEQGAEQLLGQGDMLHMVGGGRISRVHGPFVSDEEVEKVVAHLKTQGQPDYLDTVTADESDEEDADADDSSVFDKGAVAAEDGNELYDQAVKVMLRDKKCSTSYIQRRLQIGYNRAASLVERMEKEGLVGPANHVGKREILNSSRDTV
ncbi:DNA translocase FtsK [Phyllobacterium endophyticum]|uniref:DNA translocase FtsK n=1 Tax=Phyllobacterium endophyticum TaxID=1149773 RepID=UPI001FEFEF73|nr:DNA translocase FtsK [Phyllobacterium endophyticum]